MSTFKIGDKVCIKPVWEGLPRAGTGEIVWITQPREFTPEHIAVAAFGDAYTPSRCRPIPHARYFVRRDNPRNPDNPYLITISTLPLELISPIAPGHNPDQLTVERVGDGYWLPEWEVLEKMSAEVKCAHMEMWTFENQAHWSHVMAMSSPSVYCTYRTRLPREELLKLIAPKKRLIRVEELPAVCWVADVPLMCKDKAMVTAIKIDAQKLFFGSVPVGVKELHEGACKWSSDLKTWNSFEVEDKQ